MALTPGLGLHLRGLADELLVKDFPGASITRAEREMLASAVSSANDCFFCMDSHNAFACDLLSRAKTSMEVVGARAKFQALQAIALTVRASARELGREDIERAKSAGATDGDVQLAVLIASAFSMYNRMVDGLRARTPEHERAYEARASEIADRGYATR